MARDCKQTRNGDAEVVRGFVDEEQIVDHRSMQRAVEVPHGAIHARWGAGRAKIRFA